MRLIQIVLSDGGIALVNADAFISAEPTKEGNTRIHFAGGWSGEITASILEMKRLIEPQKAEVHRSVPPTRGITSEDIEEQHKKISAILHWASEEKKDFDVSFVQSLASGLDRYGHLTPAQDGALDKIIAKFKIDVDRWDENVD